MFPFLLPLLGAAGGAVLNKKNPLKGALLGGGLAAGGGALMTAGGLGGLGAASGGAADAALAAQGYAGPEALAGQGIFGQAKGLLSTAGQYAKPIGEAAGAANQVGGLLSQPQQQPPMPQQQGGPGVGQAIGGILQGQQQLDQQRMDEARKRMGLLGGGYGR